MKGEVITFEVGSNFQEKKDALERPELNLP